MSDVYRLEGKVPVPVAGLLEWGAWFETANRTVALDKINRVTVSTIFLGVDHRFTGSGPPLLFETRIFGGKLDGHQFRAPTWELALEDHALACALVRKD